MKPKTLELLPKDTGGNIPCEIVHASNEARFTTAHYNEPLSAFTVGWQDPENLEELLEFMAPAVPDTPRRFHFKKATNSEAFLSETDDVRAIGSAFKRIEFTGEEVDSRTYNKGLTIRVDHDDVHGDNWRETYTSYLMTRLLRNEVRRAMAIHEANATNVAKTWNSGKNPDSDVRASLVLGLNGAGVRPNRIIIGDGAWDKRANVYEATNTPYAGRAAGMTIEEWASKLGVDTARVVAARYQSTATAKAAVLGAKVIMYYALSGILKDDPSHIKRFVTPSTGGGRFGVYIEEHAKYTDISVEHYSNTIATSTVGERMITVS